MISSTAISEPSIGHPYVKLHALRKADDSGAHGFWFGPPRNGSIDAIKLVKELPKLIDFKPNRIFCNTKLFEGATELNLEDVCHRPSVNCNYHVIRD